MSLTITIVISDVPFQENDRIDISQMQPRYSHTFVTSEGQKDQLILLVIEVCCCDNICRFNFDAAQ